MRRTRLKSHIQPSPVSKVYHGGKKVIKAKTNKRSILKKRAKILTDGFGDKSIRVRFPFNAININDIKGVHGRKFFKDGKYWTVPLTLDNCVALKKLNYEFSSPLRNWANEAWAAGKEGKSPVDIPGLNCTLKDYQKDGFRFIKALKGRAILGDDMGLGKTVQALAWAQYKPERLPIIVICTASLKQNWYREILKFTTFREIHIIQGTRTELLPEAEIYIINYDITYIWYEKLISIKPQLVILDEVHKIKNGRLSIPKRVTKKTKIVQRTLGTALISKASPELLELSGTLIEKEPIELYNPVSLIDPLIFPSAWEFKQRYCNPKHNGFGWTFEGVSNVKELHEKLKRVMIRRLKKDVLKELPPKVYTSIPIEITNRKEYNEAQSNFINYVRAHQEIKVRELIKDYFFDDLEGAVEVNDMKLDRMKEEAEKKANPLAQLTALQQLSVKGKMKGIIDWVTDFLETGEKLVVFCEHRATVAELETHFKKVCVKIDGGVSMTKRDQAVQAFQNDKKIKLFIGNSAAQEGLTLTAASNVAVVEFPWNPGALNQRIDRCHRITQKFTVNVWYLVGLNTIDEKLAKILSTKMEVLSAVLDGKEVETSDLLTELINELKQE